MARERLAPRPPRADLQRHWSALRAPHHPRLRDRRFGHIWWCGPGCRLGVLFAFTTWAAATVIYHDTEDLWPVWEALEYNPTGQTSLWEADWGYVEFTPIATYKSIYRVRLNGRIEERWRWCRDFLRVVVRNDGVVQRFQGTACRNDRRSLWRIARSYRVS